MSNALDDLRQTLADVICSDRAVDNWQATPSDYDLADAIIAALPGLVKPLEWEDHPKDAPVISQAFVQGGGYFICDDTDDFTGAYLEFVSCDNVKWWQHVRSTSVELQGGFHDEDVTPLKAAAQAHHVAQIMAAFGIDAAAMKEGKDA